MTGNIKRKLKTANSQITQATCDDSKKHIKLTSKNNKNWKNSDYLKKIDHQVLTYN